MAAISVVAGPARGLALKRPNTAVTLPPIKRPSLTPGALAVCLSLVLALALILVSSASPRRTASPPTLFVRVSGSDPEMLRYLGARGIAPGSLETLWGVNLAGGQPLSMVNLKATYELCRRHGVTETTIHRWRRKRAPRPSLRS